VITVINPCLIRNLELNTLPSGHFVRAVFAKHERRRRRNRFAINDLPRCEIVLAPKSRIFLCFQSKVGLKTEQKEMINNDAMVNIYFLVCPKLCVLFVFVI